MPVAALIASALLAFLGAAGTSLGRDAPSHRATACR